MAFSHPWEVQEQEEAHEKKPNGDHGGPAPLGGRIDGSQGSALMVDAHGILVGSYDEDRAVRDGEDVARWLMGIFADFGMRSIRMVTRIETRPR